mmetsp:Transcript_6190/g.12156  ORF Transcript_6190/g.12156 Transcript_6190/m.12156 type:complete len:120 (+) Transcript_6190:524-883(+)
MPSSRMIFKVYRREANIRRVAPLHALTLSTCSMMRSSGCPRLPPEPHNHDGIHNLRQSRVSHPAHVSKEILAWSKDEKSTLTGRHDKTSVSISCHGPGRFKSVLSRCGTKPLDARSSMI